MTLYRKFPDDPESEAAQARDKGGAKPARAERRSKSRVANNQGTGEGTATALSKLKMIERHKSELRPLFYPRKTP